MTLRHYGPFDPVCGPSGATQERRRFYAQVADRPAQSHGPSAPSRGTARRYTTPLVIGAVQINASKQILFFQLTPCNSILAECWCVATRIYNTSILR
jgi:hypothetical protein